MIRVIRQLGLSVMVFTFGLAILLTGTFSTLGSVPNPDEDSHPDRVQLSQCIADVKQVTQWNDEETRQTALKVCHARKVHAKEKAWFLAALGKLNDQYKDYTNHGFSQHLPTATTAAWTIVKSCIDFKEGFTAPHNVGTLSVPENVRSSCYTLGSSLVEAQLFPPK